MFLEMALCPLLQCILKGPVKTTRKHDWVSLSSKYILFTFCWALNSEGTDLRGPNLSMFGITDLRSMFGIQIYPEKVWKFYSAPL